MFNSLWAQSSMTAKPESLTNLTGLVLSAGCVVHCMLMPLCIASLPRLGLGWLASSGFHQVLALAGVGIGMATLIPGWRLHGRHRVLVFAISGLGIMNFAAFSEEDCCAHGSCENTQAVSTNETYEGASLTAGTKQASVAATELITSAWQWLWAHPTAFGATLLALAHFMNGSCTRTCCGQQDTCETA
jgi:hypothetical protein